ncbi:MAG: hypothetical protein RQ741_03875 [Wenzhouxiangellaceae bacterium]|nr:hypothetical protein [Wenzhouxiangellaceae bacterium]
MDKQQARARLRPHVPARGFLARVNLQGVDMNDPSSKTKTSRNEFIDKMKERLDDLDERIEELKKKGDEFEGQARKEYENRLNDLREKRRDAEKRIKEVQAAGEERWQAVKDEAEHAWKALGNSFNYFKSHFK